MAKATLINSQGQKQVVDSGSQQAQDLFGQGYSLMGAPSNTPSAPTPPAQPTPAQPNPTPNQTPQPTQTQPTQPQPAPAPKPAQPVQPDQPAQPTQPAATKVNPNVNGPVGSMFTPNNGNQGTQIQSQTQTPFYSAPTGSTSLPTFSPIPTITPKTPTLNAVPTIPPVNVSGTYNVGDMMTPDLTNTLPSDSQMSQAAIDRVTNHANESISGINTTISGLYSVYTQQNQQLLDNNQAQYDQGNQGLNNVAQNIANGTQSSTKAYQDMLAQYNVQTNMATMQELGVKAAQVQQQIDTGVAAIGNNGFLADLKSRKAQQLQQNGNIVLSSLNAQAQIIGKNVEAATQIATNAANFVNADNSQKIAAYGNILSAANTRGGILSQNVKDGILAQVKVLEDQKTTIQQQVKDVTTLMAQNPIASFKAGVTFGDTPGEAAAKIQKFTAENPQYDFANNAVSIINQADGMHRVLLDKKGQVLQDYGIVTPDDQTKANMVAQLVSTANMSPDAAIAYVNKGAAVSYLDAVGKQNGQTSPSVFAMGIKANNPLLFTNDQLTKAGLKAGVDFTPAKDQVGGDTAAARNNNPGNIRDPKTHKFVKYPDMASGYQAMIGDLQFKMSGQSTHNIPDGPNAGSRLTGMSSLADMIRVYAPSSDHNDPVSYAADIAGKLGVKETTPIGQLDPTQLAEAMARHEDPNYYNQLALAGVVSGKYVGNVVPTIAQTGTGALDSQIKIIDKLGVSASRYFADAGITQEDWKNATTYSDKINLINQAANSVPSPLNQPSQTQTAAAPSYGAYNLNEKTATNNSTQAFQSGSSAQILSTATKALNTALDFSSKASPTVADERLLLQAYANAYGNGKLDDPSTQQLIEDKFGVNLSKVVPGNLALSSDKQKEIVDSIKQAYNQSFQTYTQGYGAVNKDWQAKNFAKSNLPDSILSQSLVPMKNPKTGEIKYVPVGTPFNGGTLQYDGTVK